ncbi:DUF805 domain-containing protein [Affinibrenneria salicis]|uniref:DUF805 domain-containing protein n=1 Tax=Affinibrenneria salicis TaxID=2590031 RepID=A0A5J5FQG3_9GAMM|nr:DUF805 domain-containing protein [Affinibrenneria salicis]KAA8995177.1 DUF805 domain-containing protein [Affinibrenneria salicis]
MQWYLNVLKNYVGFSGRARRKEYWMFYLFNIIVSLVVAIIDTALGLNAILLMIYALAILLPGLAVTVRRLHDIGKSGWWILISMVPFVGGLVLVAFTCMDSQPAENQFGPNPKLA